MLRLEDNDQRITYSSDWLHYPNLTDSQTTTWGGSPEFFVLFRGTSLKLYGNLYGPGYFLLDLDGNRTYVQNNTNDLYDYQPQLIFNAGNLADGDHQLHGYINFTDQTYSHATVGHFEIENSSGGGFDMLSTGPTATNVPTKAVTVDNPSSYIMFQNTSVWSHDENVASYGRSISRTSTNGASLSFAFDGVAIWYYGQISALCAFFTVSINGSTPQRLDCNSNLSQGESLDQRMLWSNTSLGPGRHNITLTHDDVNTNRLLSLDFFRILREEDAPVLHSTSSTTSFTVLPTDAPQVAPIKQVSTVPLAVGLTVGLLALATVVLGSVCYLDRRRRRMHTELDAPTVSPYTIHPMTQPDPQAGLPPQPTRLAGAFTDIGGFGLSGPPPSYRGPDHSGSVAPAE